MDHVPDQIGPYQVLRRLGAGGMGEVYLANDTRLFRRVAVKRITFGGGGDRERLLQEARAAARLNHPGIASVYDVLETDEGAYMVMEYVGGQTLDRALDDGPLPIHEVLDIGSQLAVALAEAHRLGVVHRDLKPANIAVTDSGVVKILDFGLAERRRELGSSSTAGLDPGTGQSAGTIMGSPPYVPPEYYLGQPVDERGDIYSLGVTLFELLTGQRPFVGADVAQVMAAVVGAPTPHVRDVRPIVPERLDAVVARAIARDPAERFASAAAMGDAIRAVEVDVSAVTAAMPSGRASGSSVRPRRLSWGGASLVAALAVLIAVLVPARDPAARADGPPVIAVLSFARAGGDPQEEALAAGVADVLTSSLSKIGGVTVIPRSSLAGQKVTEPAALGRSLGASAVVTGSLQKVQDRVRLVVQIMRPGSDALFWSETFDGSTGEIFALQGQAATGVASALRLRTTPAQEAELQIPATGDPRAFAEYSLGVSLIERPDVPGNVDRAIQQFESAIQRDRRFARAHAGAGYAYWERFKVTHDPRWADQARVMTMEALRLDPRDVAVRCALARIYLGTGRPEEAADELRQAISQRPDADVPHLLLGRQLQQTGRTEEGIAEIRRAIALRPNYWSHHQDLGLALYLAGRYDEAAASFRRVIELQPDNSRGYQMLGMVEHAQGHRARALADYKRAIELAPDAQAYSNLGLFYYEDKRWADAAAAFEKAAALDPKSAVKQRNLGDLYRKVGREEDARRAYARARDLTRVALEVNPSDASALATLALCEAKLGDLAAALRDAATAATMTGAGPDVLYKRAVVLALAGRPEEGVRALAEAVSAGYSVRFIESDDDAAPLRAVPAYRTVIARGPAVVKDGGAQ